MAEEEEMCAGACKGPRSKCDPKTCEGCDCPEKEEGTEEEPAK
ncbi:MAG TPA: hypothetical protein VJL27_03340 [Patescibacteria group bacterium]|nr:hypothetical protein [Patescibacteria group bacterium]